MTDHEIELIENEALYGEDSSLAIMRLASELKRTTKERDWLAKKYADALNELPTRYRMTFVKALSLAKEALCQKT